jgi:hypothetical protein
MFQSFRISKMHYVPILKSGAKVLKSSDICKKIVDFLFGETVKRFGSVGVLVRGLALGRLVL